jgi:lambda repressor-like predicted transcriptional regulator
MPTNNDAFWDELGISWRASIGDERWVSSRLETRLKLQSALLTAGTVAGATISLLGFALAAWTLWIGWSREIWHFLARGATLAIVSLLAFIATLALWARNGVETRSLREMLQASIARTERLIAAADLGCYAVVILALGGMVGYALRIRFGRPAAMSPVEGLLAAAVVGLSLVWYRRSQAQTLRKLRHLDQVFGSGGDM